MAILFSEPTETDFIRGEHYLPTLEGADEEELARYEALRKKYLAEKTGKSVDEIVIAS